MDASRQMIQERWESSENLRELGDERINVRNDLKDGAGGGGGGGERKEIL